MTYNDVAGYVRSNRNHEGMVIGLGSNGLNGLKFGDFVLGSFNERGEFPIGFVVQVRKGCGAFGSDVVILREHNEVLSSHSNQAFWKLPDDQVEMIRPHFEYLPEIELEENPDIMYSIAGEREYSGFLVIEDDHEEIATCSMAITITEDK